jgi:asparagine synthase (glutamine-hydrolysing)
MCGIVGMVQVRNGPPLESGHLLRMREALRHRGPDDAGIWLSHNGRVGLAHRRLSILDLSEAGRQPMHDEIGDAWVTYNGEIYNFMELREVLEKRGHRFSSSTDTEVLLAAYREWKEHCLDRLNGMFAFAFYDAPAGRLFLARDRAGKKPLYYALSGGRFLFASEPKALLQDPAVSREIDLRALNFFLAYGFVPGDLCIFRSIRRLPPAHAMTLDLDSGNIRRWRYWSLPGPAQKRCDEEDLLAELECLLGDAVRLRLRSDVPLGVFLSGGLDSSLVVALVSRVSSHPVETFTIGFEEAARDERCYARIIADHFGTRHNELVIRPDTLQVLSELVQQFDEPLADPSIIPTYYVCRETRKNVTVALSGDGGDELFGGYRRYSSAYRDARLMRFLPASLRRWAANGSHLFPVKSWPREYFRRLQGDAKMAFIGRRFLFDLEARSSLLDRDVLGELGKDLLEPEAYLRTSFKQTLGHDFVNQMTASDFNAYLPDDVLVKVDRASMFVSLEVRSPLLDYRVVDFAFSRVPGSLKVNKEGNKIILKRLAQRLLPPSLPLNRKAGFGIPLRAWLQQGVGDLSSDVLATHNGLFNCGAMKRIIHSGGEGLILHDRRVFALIGFELWRQAYGALL